MKLCAACQEDQKNGTPVLRVQCLWCGRNVCIHLMVKDRSLCTQCEAMRHGE